MSVRDRIRIVSKETLSDAWSVLTRNTYDWRRSNGTWQRQVRESYDRGDGVALLLYNLDKRTVVLTRQLRFPAFLNGCDDLLIEVPAGVLDEKDPEKAILRETEEETGFRVSSAQPVFRVYMSPGAVTEKLHFFIAPYSDSDRLSDGGGVEGEGEDIEVLELAFGDAMQMIADGAIQDGKTIMLLQHAALTVFAD